MDLRHLTKKNSFDFPFEFSSRCNVTMQCWSGIDTRLCREQQHLTWCELVDLFGMRYIRISGKTIFLSDPMQWHDRQMGKPTATASIAFGFETPSLTLVVLEDGGEDKPPAITAYSHLACRQVIQVHSLRRRQRLPSKLSQTGVMGTNTGLSRGFLQMVPGVSWKPTPEEQDL